MKALDTILTDLNEVDEQIAVLTEDIRANKSAKYLAKLVNRKTGELDYLTKSQYKKYVSAGKEPRASIVNKKGRIPWHYALDELATIAGYQSDEQLRDAIHSVKSDIVKLGELKDKRAYIIDDVKQHIPDHPELKVRVTCGTPPIFGSEGELTKWKEYNIGNTQVLIKRNPSFNVVEIDDKETDVKPDITLNARYSKDADKLAKQFITDEIDSYDVQPALLQLAGISRRKRKASIMKPFRAKQKHTECQPSMSSVRKR